MRDDPLVEPLEARGEERQRRLGRELLDDGLGQRPTLGRQRDHALVGRAAVDRVERGRDDVDAQHHPGAAAVGLVVDLAAAQRRRVAVVEEPELELGPENGRERPLFGHPCERMRNLGEDVETHSRSRLLVVAREAAGDEDPAFVEVDVEHAGLDERQQQAGVEGERVVGRSVLHLGDRTERAAAFLLDAEPDELEDVVGVLARARAGPRGGRPAWRRAATDRSSLITGRPPAPRFETVISAGLPSTSSTAPRAKRSGASLAPSTKKEPSTPCGRPTRPTVTSSLNDVEDHALARSGGARAHDRAQRPGEPALAADHLAAVIGGDVELEHGRILALDLLDAHGIGIVDELLRKPGEQLRHYELMPAALISLATASEGCAPLPSHSVTFASSRSIVEGSVCGL